MLTSGIVFDAELLESSGKEIPAPNTFVLCEKRVGAAY